ncbi:hypothetical protein MNBD_GAMMA02-363 [hydrothermal vent metagenome]|uniref:Uncharacterized protein n=2 Tax=hydrothermal vent metagenome TaxID=652676 RepID=A0A3B0W890_9ZZZZ
MNKQVTIILLCLLSLVGFAKDKQQIIEQTESDKSTYAKDNLKNDLAVAFGEKSIERQTSEKEFAAWGKKLKEFLMASDDDFAQASTLAKMISNLQTASMLAKLHNKNDQVDALNDLSYQPFADLLNQMIAKAELSAVALDILTKVCFTREMADHCHANVLLEKRMQQDTANLQAYLRPFDIAAKANNTKSMHQLIQLMAASQYSRTPLGITDNMSTLIDAFIANNPIPQSAVDNMITDYQKLSGISPEKKTQLDELMPAYMSTFIKSSFFNLNDFPPYKPILSYCQTNIDAVTYCRDITQIMIQKSNSMIDKAMGHSLLIATYELERNQVGIDATTQLNEKFRQTYKCIGDLGSGKYFIDDYFDPELQKITFNATDEYQMMIQQAELRYRNLKAQGDINATNPDSCFDEG